MSVAKPIPHDATRLHVTGQARYVDDVPTPANTLHLAFGLSKVTSGRILSMSLDAVCAWPDVVAVLTADDLPHTNDVSPSIHDEPLLAQDRVHYVGQPIFLVVARSHLAARYAARAGSIEIEADTPLLSIDAALAINNQFEDAPRVYGRGDVDGAIAAADHVISGQLEVGGQEHFYLEGQAALAQPQEGGDMLVQSSTQHPTEIQHKVAEALGTPMHAVRVETRRMGGGFGGKESQGNALAVACAVAAQLTGRPCKMRYDRDDDMTITGKRHEFRITYKVGCDASGKISGLDFTHLVRCGWAQDLSLPVADRAMFHADNAYYLPAVRITSHRLKTNTQSATAFCGFGGPQGMLGVERVMDHIAAKLSLDPLLVRQANSYDNDPSGNVTPYGQVVEDFVVPQMEKQLRATSDYDARLAAVVKWNSNNPVLKKGLALTPVKFGISFTLTHLNQAGALVHVYQDGSVQLNHGGTEMGQGLFQKVAQVAAARFGIDIEQVKITATDTAKVPNTSATAASSGSDLNGMAVQAACDTIKSRMADFLAQEHQCESTNVTFQDCEVLVAGARYSFAKVVHKAYIARISLSSTGFYKTPQLAWDRIKGQGRPFFYFAYGVTATEVVIDTLTGENRILRADILHDAGQSLNPALDIGQVEGGYVQGAGWLTTEELIWDDAGRLRTHAPSAYKIPACSDRPDVFNVALWQAPNPAETVYRSKAVDEPPLMLGISAYSALCQDVQVCGPHYADLQASATAESIIRSVHKARGEVTPDVV